MPLNNPGRSVISGFFLTALMTACSGPDSDVNHVDPAALREELLQADKEFSAVAFEQGVERAY